MTAEAICGTQSPRKMQDLGPQAIAQSGPIVLSENASFVCFGPPWSAMTCPGVVLSTYRARLEHVPRRLLRLDALRPDHYRSRNLSAAGPPFGAGSAKASSI